MRKTGLFLIGLGVFLVVLAPMIRFYAYPRLAVAPANANTMTGLVAKNATIFDKNSFKLMRTDLTIKVATHGDSSTPSNCPGAVTYVNQTRTFSADGVERSWQMERETFNARTGESVSCGKDFIDNGKDVTTDAELITHLSHTGLTAKFPFDTQKQTYQFWDSTLMKSSPIAYTGTTTFQGLKVYTFHQNIPATTYGTMSFPENLLGIKGHASVPATENYSVDRTLLVEPATGVIIQRTEAQRSWLTYQGHELLLSDATVQYDPATVSKNVNDYGSQATTLKFVRTGAPIVGFVLGLIALIAGIALARHERHAADSEKADDKELAHV